MNLFELSFSGKISIYFSVTYFTKFVSSFLLYALESQRDLRYCCDRARNMKGSESVMGFGQSTDVANIHVV